MRSLKFKIHNSKLTIIALALTTALLSTVPFVEAQPAKKLPRIGLLSPFSPSATALWHEAFRKGLRDLGWVEGKNISIEYRYAEGKADRLPDLAADLVRLKVDVIVAAVNTDALAAKKVTGQSLSLWRLRVTLLHLGLLRAWRGLAATSRGCPK